MDEIAAEPNIRGSLRTIGEAEFLRMKSRDDVTRHGTDADFDLLEYATLQATGLGDPRISAFASARYEANSRQPAASELHDLADSEPARRHLKLFDAFVEARDLAAGHLTVRAGRQSIDGFDPVSIDGARVDLANVSFFRATGFAGYRATTFSETDDRPVFGGEIGARFPFGLDIIAGATHYVVDGFGVEAREDFTPDLSLTARAEAIDGDLSEARVKGRFRIAPAGLELRLGYIRWFETSRFPYDYTYEKDHPRGIERLHVGPRTDGNEASAEALFDLVPHTVLSLRGRIFRPIGADDDPYNLPYWEVSPGVELYDLPWRGFEADFRYSAFRAKTGPPSDIDPTTVEGFTDLRGEGISRYDEVELDLAQRFGRAVRAELGGVFRREDYETRFGKIDGAKGWDMHAKVVWLATGSWTFVLRYDFARDFDLVAPAVDWDQRVRLEVRYAF